MSAFHVKGEKSDPSQHNKRLRSCRSPSVKINLLNLSRKKNGRELLKRQELRDAIHKKRCINKKNQKRPVRKNNLRKN